MGRRGRFNMADATDMGFKRFLEIFAGVMIIFLLANYVVWKTGSELLLTKESDGGDLARLSYLRDFKHLRKNSFDLPLRHELLTGFGKHYDLLTIGDSFSLGMGEGRNQFYQDYIATNSAITVANLWPYPAEDSVAGVSPLTNLILLYNSGLLDAIKPRYVLLESAERYCVRRFARPYDFDMHEPPDKLVAFYRRVKYDFDYLPSTGFLNSGNPKFVYYNLMYRLFGHTDKVRSFQLARRVFSVGEGNRLLVALDEVSNTGLTNPAAVKLINDNMNRMADLLKRKGIQLYFMPVIDKYDLYREIITEDPACRYPRSNFFEELRKLPKGYGFIDTKALLAPELRRGEQDIYYADDTHWSWKAPQIIFSTILFDGR